MKKTVSLLFGLISTALLNSSAEAATINFSSTAVGNRIVTTTTPFSPAPGGTLILGTMTSEADFSTFSEFGRTSMGNAAPYNGGTVAGSTSNNTAAAVSFASKPIYLVIYTEGNTLGGIFKSTASFDPTLSGSASQTFNLAVASFTTAINPAQNWDFFPASVDPQGITGYAGTPPTERRGIVFDISGIPEPSTGALSLAALGFVLRRRRRGN